MLPNELINEIIELNLGLIYDPVINRYSYHGYFMKWAYTEGKIALYLLTPEGFNYGVTDLKIDSIIKTLNILLTRNIEYRYEP